MRRLREHRRVHLSQCREIVDDPERAPVRRNDEIAVLYDDVVYWHRRQVALHGLPVGAVVERDIRATFGARVEQAAPHRILADHARELVSGDAAHDLGPGRTEIRGPVQQRLEVVELEAIGGHVRRALLVVRRLHDRDAREVADPRWRHVLPRPAAVARDLHVPVVGAHPEHVRRLEALSECEHHTIRLDARLVLGDRAARGAECARIVAREWRRDDLEALALIVAAEERTAAGVEDLRIVHRDHDREGPLELVLDVLARPTHRVVRPGVDVALEPVAHILAGEVAGVAARIDDVGIDRIGCHVSRLAAAGVVPVADRNATRLAAGGAERRVVLLRAAHAVREVVRGGDVVELRGGEVLLAPRRAAVGAHHRTAVIALDHAERVVRRDPQVVVVAMRDIDLRLERLPAVGALEELHVERVDDARVLGVGDEARVVPRALAQVAVAVEELPGRSAIIGTVGATRVGLDLRPNAARVHRRDCDSDLAEHPAREAGVGGELLPGGATVGGLHYPTARTARVEHPRRAVGVPEARVERVRVGGIHDQVPHTGRVVAEEDLDPVLSAVGGLEYAALLIPAKGVTECAHVHDVRIGRVHAYAPDVPRFLQAHQRPGLAGIDGLPKPVTVRCVAADVGLTAAHVHDVRVRLGHADRADGATERTVGHRLPVRAAVDGLPHTAAGGTHPVLKRTAH